MSSTASFALVADDDPIILMDACQILEDAGFLCHQAGTGEEAVSVLEQLADSVTLLFTDVEMPGDMNGFQLAFIVAERWPQIEIVVASGRMKPGPGDMPDKVTFIGKPFSAQIVHDHLREKLPEGKKPEPLKTSA
jgi:CheY-like chemotaxis protein